MPIPAALKSVLVPGSITFLALCAVVYLVLRYGWPRGHRISRWWALGIGAAYLIMSLPLVATRIADRLPATPVTAEETLPPIDALIVLDGDNRVGRVETADRIWKRASPRVICVLGADWVVAALTAAGIPRERIMQTTSVGNTREQIAWVQRFLAGTPEPHAALIASRLQMPRVARLVRAAHLQLTLVASPIDDEPPRNGIRALVPTYIGLRTSRDALYEHAALALYSWRGWLGEP
jgi:uncharacterized SAM-binding protein YcdF (DUF218 family)